RFQQKVTEAPSSVSVITSAEIKRYGYRNLADALKSIRGFYVTYDRTYQYLGSRGFSRPNDFNTRYLLLVNRHRLNDNIYDTAQIGNELPLDLDLVDRIEIIRGPGSSLYGSNAFFGVINVVTKAATDFDGIEASAEAASFDTYKSRVTYGKNYSNGAALSASATRSRSNGQSLFFREYADPATNNGNADNCDEERYGNAFMSLTYKDFTLQGAYGSRTKRIGIGSYESVFNDKRTRNTDDRGYIDLRHELNLDNHTTISSTIFYDYYRYTGNWLFDTPVLNKDIAIGKWWGLESEISSRIGDKHTVVGGVEYRDNILQMQRNYDKYPYFSYLRHSQGSYTWAAYAEDQYKISGNLLLNTGIRYDHYKIFGDTVNPRIALIYNPLEKTTIKLLYGTAFRTPNAYELYYGDGFNTQKPNPGLKPEKVSTYEMILEQYLGNYRFSFSGFYYRARDMISQQIDPVDGLIVFRNADEVESKGLEFEVQGRWAKDIEGQLSYSYQETRDKTTGRLLTNAPKHLLKANVYAPIIRKYLSAGVEAQYTGPRRTLAGTSTGGFITTNLTLLNRELVKGLEISGTVYNIFDTK
ncbi:MAG TPA: TonB-dependent receptor, partial [Syntrophorhabdaceae bacterium]|nr:TonB-dependent receptor [Syntrophorhabdaceae bacterium]